MTVREVSRKTGVSVRTLQYYDQIGLLRPKERTGAGYRQYDEESLKKLQQILLFRSLEFPLKEIRDIMDNPFFDPLQALDDQIQLLNMKKQHLESLIDLARQIKASGGKFMKFNAFDTRKMDEYASQAKARWGQTKEYKEFEQKDQGRAPEERKQLSQDMMGIFAEFGKLKGQPPASQPARELVKELQSFISAHFYACSDQVLLSLGRMYVSGGDMTRNIDAAGGEGTAAFACRAIEAYCRGKE